MFNYYNKDVYGKIQLTPEGQYTLEYFGLTVQDIKDMTAEQLQKHCKKFSDVLNDGKIRKSGKFQDHHIIDTPTTQEIFGKYQRKDVKNQISYGDSGSFSRYFSLDRWFDTTFPFIITPKASTSERNKGLDAWIDSTIGDGRKKEIDNPFQRGLTTRKNLHPTVKPLKLMAWLVTLLSRPNDIVLDPFCGSGTTCIAAKLLKRQYIGIEINEEYAEIARQRINTTIF